MVRQVATRTGKCLYAIIDNSREHLERIRGIDGSPVYQISNTTVAAVVSNVRNTRIRPERRHLAAHQKILNCLMAKSTPLPMRFGIIAGSDADILRFLKAHEMALEEQLQRVAGKMEMGLRVEWRVPNVFEHLVAIHPELRALRDKLFLAKREPTHEEKVELGRAFDRILNKDRKTCHQKVWGVLSPLCFETKSNPPRRVAEILNMACLVGKGAQAQFEAGVAQAAKLFDDNFCFTSGGPWAPHNFVNAGLRPEQIGDQNAVS